jgi:hypothetical protein
LFCDVNRQWHLSQPAAIGRFGMIVAGEKAYETNEKPKILPRLWKSEDGL